MVGGAGGSVVEGVTSAGIGTGAGGCSGSSTKGSILKRVRLVIVEKERFFILSQTLIFFSLPCIHHKKTKNPLDWTVLMELSGSHWVEVYA
jgi:hypothetical protein